MNDRNLLWAIAGLLMLLVLVMGGSVLTQSGKGEREFRIDQQQTTTARDAEKLENRVTRAESAAELVKGLAAQHLAISNDLMRQITEIQKQIVELQKQIVELQKQIVELQRQVRK